MSSPIDGTPASRAPRLPASMIPGPPPVMIEKPARPSAAAVSRAFAYIGSSRGGARGAEDRDGLADVREAVEAGPQLLVDPLHARGVVELGDDRRRVGLEQLLVGRRRRRADACAGTPPRRPRSSRRRRSGSSIAVARVQGPYVRTGRAPAARRSILWCEWRGHGSPIATIAGAGGWRPPGGGAARRRATPSRGSSRPSWSRRTGAVVRSSVVGRDRDDVVRGAEIAWGDGQPAQGLSACERSARAAPSAAAAGRKAAVRALLHLPRARATTRSRCASSPAAAASARSSAPRPRTLTVDVG